MKRWRERARRSEPKRDESEREEKGGDTQTHTPKQQKSERTNHEPERASDGSAPGSVTNRHFAGNYLHHTTKTHRNKRERRVTTPHHTPHHSEW